MMNPFDDIVVVPCINLNPKKAKQSMQKQKKKEKLQEQPQQQQQQQQQQQEPKRAKQRKSQKDPDLNGKKQELELEEMSTSASEGEEAFSGRRSSPASCARSVPSFAEMKRSFSAKSWFDVSEDDEDDFILALKDKERFMVPVVTTQKSAAAQEVPVSVAAPPAVVQQTSAFLEMLIGSLDASVLAQVFLCLELGHVGSWALVCKFAKSMIWDDIPFWHALGGPAFTREQPEHVLRLGNPTVQRNRFRVWVYGLDGDWTSSFRILADERDHKDVFAEASYMLAGMEASDGEEEIQSFCKTCAEQLAILDASDKKAKDAAFHFMGIAVRRDELLGTPTLEEMREALEDSVERALVLQANDQLEDYDGLGLSVGPFELAEHLALDPVKQTEIPVDADQEKLQDGCLSLAFLTALGNRHEGMDVRMAQERVANRVASADHA